MRPAIALLLMIGLLLGPGYYAYCLLLSGRTAQTIEMTERAARWVTPDGTILRFPGGMAYKPVPLGLVPEMNRVTIRLRFAFSERAGAATENTLQYQASLAQGDHTILERPIAIEAESDATRTVGLGPMDIPFPAEYLFVLEQVGSPQFEPRLTLEVIEGVETPLRSVVWAGIGLLLIAAALAVRDVIVAARLTRGR